jgi:hypothetical protein
VLIMELEKKEECSPLTVEQAKERLDLKIELLQILDEEELYWLKRCYETCLLKGDNNTKFFHWVANGKRRKQTIFTLKNGDHIVYGDDNLLAHTIEYYKALFDPGGGNAFKLDQDLSPLEDNVTMHENCELTKPF